MDTLTERKPTPPTWFDTSEARAVFGGPAYLAAAAFLATLPPAVSVPLGAGRPGVPPEFDIPEFADLNSGPVPLIPAELDPMLVGHQPWNRGLAPGYKPAPTDGERIRSLESVTRELKSAVRQRGEQIGELQQLVVGLYGHDVGEVSDVA